MLVIAHRGASLARPENTLAAFREARRLGADMVELDARRTADGAVAVRHDPDLPLGRALFTHTAAELYSLFPEIPSLDAAIDACEGMSVNVELKNLDGEPDFDPSDALADAVVEVIARRRVHDRALVSSFRLAAIDRVRTLDAAVPTAWLTLPGRDPHEAVATCADGGHIAIHPHHLAVTAELVDAAHGAGLVVNTWTVDDPVRMTELVDLGVDGICTNAPDVLRRTLNDYTR